MERYSHWDDLVMRRGTRAAEIDVERAGKARDRAEQRLRSTNPDTDFDRARIALGRAISRLQIAGR